MTETKRAHLLLTNDDGIGAEGIRRLADVLEPHYDLMIVAPHHERSGAGHSITVMRNLWLEQYRRDDKQWGWSFEGSPADCVKVAVATISKERPFDLVLSGINRGHNLGVNVLYSGTVAGAREGCILGIPSIAFSVSFDDIKNIRFDTASAVALEVVRRALEKEPTPDLLLNVNVPHVSFDEIKGYAITRQGSSQFKDKFEHVEGHPEENRLLRNVGERYHHSPEPDIAIDDQAVKNGYVSITPLHIDSTAYHHMEKLGGLMDS